VPIQKLGRLDLCWLLLNLPASEWLQWSIDVGAPGSDCTRSRHVDGLSADHGMSDARDDTLSFQLRLGARLLAGPRLAAP